MVWKELLHKEICVVIWFIKHRWVIIFLFIITFIERKFLLSALWKHWQWSNWKWINFSLDFFINIFYPSFIFNHIIALLPFTNYFSFSCSMRFASSSARYLPCEFFTDWVKYWLIAMFNTPPTQQISSFTEIK